MSFCTSLTVTAIDALASPGPISEAKSKPVDPLEVLYASSGNVKLISDILLLIFYILVFYSYFYKLNSLLS